MSFSLKGAGSLAILTLSFTKLKGAEEIS